MQWLLFSRELVFPEVGPSRLNTDRIIIATFDLALLCAGRIRDDAIKQASDYCGFSHGEK